MDGEHVKKTKKQAKGLERNISDAGNVLFAFWIRCTFSIVNGSHWIILDSRRYLLLRFRIILCLLYFAVQILKQI